MAVLCGMPTIQYSTQTGLLSVHKLFTSCIRRCLVSRACEWVMSVLPIFSFQFRSAFLQCRLARPHSGVLGLSHIQNRMLPKIWVTFLYSPGEWFCIDSNGNKLAHYGTGSRLLLVLGDTAYLHASLVDLYLHNKFHWNHRNFLWTDG